jgi:hypothetical protein
LLRCDRQNLRNFIRRKRIGLFKTIWKVLHTVDGVAIYEPIGKGVTKHLPQGNKNVIDPLV